jgi:hypothetical protein
MSNIPFHAYIDDNSDNVKLFPLLCLQVARAMRAPQANPMASVSVTPQPSGFGVKRAEVEHRVWVGAGLDDNANANAKLLAWEQNS